MRTIATPFWAGLIAIALLSPVRADTFALVIGVDDYLDPAISDLPGAARDAHDIHQSLLGIPDIRVTKLIGREASKSRIVEAFREMIRASATDDTLIFSYAGHGVQLPDRNGDEEDGMDEAFLLPDFRMDAMGEDSLLFDDEMDALIREAAPREVLLIADSCHSSTAVRGASPLVRGGKSRMVRIEHPLPLGTGTTGREALLPPENAILLAAIHESLEVEEVMIDGEWRGALSWAAARAFEGQADQDADGLLNVDEVFAYVEASVRSISENRQTPAVWKGTEVGSRPLLRVGNVREPQFNPEDTVRLHIVGADQTVAGDRLGSIATLADSDTADLHLDASSGAVISPMGDTLATLAPQWTEQDVSPIVEKLRLAKFLRPRADGQIAAQLSHGDRVYLTGEKTRLSIRSTRDDEILAFVIDPDGVLWGLTGPTEMRSQEELLIPLRIAPPTGVYYIVIAIPGASNALSPLLELNEGKALTTDLTDRLMTLLERQPVYLTNLYSR